MSSNLINSINGPVVTIKGPTDLTMQEMVYVGSKKLIGEVISCLLYTSDAADD